MVQHHTAVYLTRPTYTENFLTKLLVKGFLKSGPHLTKLCWSNKFLLWNSVHIGSNLRNEFDNKMASDIIERWKASAQRQLCLLLLPFTHARSEYINADSLNSNFLQLGRRSVGRPQRAVHPHAVTCQHCDTHYFSRPRTRNLPIVGPTRYQ